MPNLNVRIEVDGYQQLLDKLGVITTVETMRGPLTRAAEKIRNLMSAYPPERPGQTYERTGNLGRGWTSNVFGASATVRNHVAYGPWVQGDKTQARVHRGRWLTDQMAVDRLTPEIEADFQETINKALEQ